MKAVKPRRERLRRAKPSGLPNGRVRDALARENKVRRRVRPKRAAGKLAPRRMRSPHMQELVGLTDGPYLMTSAVVWAGGQKVFAESSARVVSRIREGCPEGAVVTRVLEQLWVWTRGRCVGSEQF